MKQIYFATRNGKKVDSVRRALNPLGIEVVQLEMDLPESRSYDTDEVAKEKVMHAFKKTRKTCIALDGGFYIQALNGFPKTFVNFTLETIGIEGILKLTEGKSRECEFRDSIAYLDETMKEPKVFTGVYRGILAESIQGEMQIHNWSRLHLIFIPKGETRTLAEMTPEEIEEGRKKSGEKKYSEFFGEWIMKSDVLTDEI